MHILGGSVCACMYVRLRACVCVCVNTGFTCACVKRERRGGREREKEREKGHRAERGAPKHSLDSTRAAESIHQPSPVRSLRPQNQSAERTNTYRPAPNAHPFSLCLVLFLVWLSHCSVYLSRSLPLPLLSFSLSLSLPLLRRQTIDQPSHANPVSKMPGSRCRTREPLWYFSSLGSVSLSHSEIRSKNFRGWLVSISKCSFEFTFVSLVRDPDK